MKCKHCGAMIEWCPFTKEYISNSDINTVLRGANYNCAESDEGDHEPDGEEEEISA